MTASVSGTKSRNSGEPNVVRMPLVTARSLCATGSAGERPHRAPRASLASRSRASASGALEGTGHHGVHERIDALDLGEVCAQHFEGGHFARSDATRELAGALETDLVHGSGAENEIDGAQDAQGSPKEVELERLTHIEHGERHEHAQRDDFLQDLQLR